MANRMKVRNNANDPFSQLSAFRAYTDYTRTFNLIYNEENYLAHISNWHNANNAARQNNAGQKNTDSTDHFSLTIEHDTSGASSSGKRGGAPHI